MLRRILVAGYLAAAMSATEVGNATAQDAIKIGVIIPMTGAFAAVGREVAAGAKLYIQQHEDTVAGQKIELIIRDDAGVPDNGKRLAQELIVNDKVSFLGAGATPTAMAIATLATEAKVATVVMVSGASVVTERSPYYVRTSFTLGQQSGIIADWAIQNGSKKTVCILSDWTPGAEAGTVFEKAFYQRRRPSPRYAEGATSQSGLRAVPAARARSSARHAFRVRAGGTGRNARQAVRRTRTS